MDIQHNLRQLQKKRTSNFREDETKLLIQLWGSPQIQNKLYLTHRKAPVMRILASNMQRHGFYRTPDEIKTRIRNLKCLYHRIKRTVQSGTGLGTVDPDWPHYKAMDSILSKENTQKNNKDYTNNLLEGPRCEDIKQEIEEIEINDDMESYSTNSNQGSDYGVDQGNYPSTPPPPPSPIENDKKPQQQQSLQKILPNFAIPLKSTTSTSSSSVSTITTNLNGQITKTNQVQSIPFPLLIVQQKPTTNNVANSKIGNIQTIQQNNNNNNNEMGVLLKELLNVQKENLTIEKERLKIEKEKLELNKCIGNKLIELIPIFGNIIKKIPINQDVNDETSKKRKLNSTTTTTNDDILKDSKILRSVLEKNIKKYMLGDDYDGKNDEDDDESDLDDSGIDKDNLKND